MVIFVALLATPVPGTFGKNGIADGGSDAADVQPMIVRHPAVNESMYAEAAVNRTITIKTSGRVVVEDKITVSLVDNGTFLYSINYSLPTVFQKFVESSKFFVQYFDDIDIDDANNSRTPEVFVGRELTTYTIPVDNDTLPVSNNTVSSIHILAIHEAADLISWSLHEFEQRGTFVAPIRPLLMNFNVTTADASVVFETTGNVFSAESTGDYQYRNTKLEYKNLTYAYFDPYLGATPDLDYATVIFDSTTKQEAGDTIVVPSVFEKISRYVRFDPWGRVYVTETFTVRHTGAPLDPDRPSYRRQYSLGGILVGVPDDAVVTDVYDGFGRLNLNKRNESTGYPEVFASKIKGYKAIEVSFRNEIFGGEKYTFTVTYRFEAEKLVAVDGNTYTMNATVASVFNSTVENLEVVYQLPEGAKFQDQTYYPKTSKSIMDVGLRTSRYTLSMFRHVEIVYTGRNVTEFDNRKFQITFQYSRVYALTSILNYFVWTLVVIGGTMGLLYGYALLRRKFKVADLEEIDEIKTENIPVAELEEFYNVYTEVRTITDRIYDYDQKYSRGKLSKKEYTATVKTLRKRLKSLNQRLDKAVRVGNTLPQKYRKLINNVMLAHQRLADIRSSIEKNNRKYFRKEIPKDTYLRLNSDYTAEMQKQEGIINRNLTEITRLTTS